MENIYDCIGVGFGPSNIALAIAFEEKGILANTLFLESRKEHAWHPGMMMEGTDIQHNPLRDLVTPRNPTSKYGFLNYLSVNNRMYDFLNLDAPYPPRTDYAKYVNWVASQFNDFVQLDTKVTRIEQKILSSKNKVWSLTTNKNEVFYAKTLSFGTGRSALTPKEFTPHLGDKVFHLNDYLFKIKDITSSNNKLNIGVIGGSQSAIEIILDLSSKFPNANITSITRSFGFKQKDLSPFTEKIYYPSFVDYFYNATDKRQAEMTSELWRSNYGAADHDVIAKLNFLLYEQKVTGNERIKLFFNTEVKKVKNENNLIKIDAADKISSEKRSLELDIVILATGFKNFGSNSGQELYHPLLTDVVNLFKHRTDGSIDISRDFSLINKTSNTGTPSIYINGLCESTHGFGDAGSFSLLSTRSMTIAESIESTLYNASEVSDAI